eukprot:1051712-Lingulodinium_polyedra.AAC.1
MRLSARTAPGPWHAPYSASAPGFTLVTAWGLASPLSRHGARWPRPPGSRATGPWTPAASSQ